jgi:rhombotail lipoprotein
MSTAPRRLLISCCALFLLLLGGCAGLTGKTSQQQIRTSSLVDYLYPDGKVPEDLRERQPHLKLPLRVGLAYVPDKTEYAALQLAESQKQTALERVAAHFREREFISDVVSIPQTYLAQGKGFDTLTQVAQLFDVDVIALVSYNVLSSQDNNALSLAYWTIVGAYLIPGDERSVQTFVDTAVFDLGTRKLLLRAPGLDKRERLTTMAASSGTERELVDASFDAATAQMIANLDTELDAFVAQVESEKVNVSVSYRIGYSGGATGLLPLLGLVVLVAWRRRR